MRPQTFHNVMSRVDVRPGECWTWTGPPMAHGYGQVTVLQEHRTIHTYVYETLVGPIPKGMHLGHTCHDEDKECPGGPCIHRLCVNIGHLKIQTPNENKKAGRGNPLKNLTHCKRGHPFDDENTQWTRKGYRRCRACRRVNG